jgi:hypothetical protein
MRCWMRTSVLRIGALLAVVAGLTTSFGITNAPAQPAVSLTGTYRCVLNCAPGFEGRRAFVTQNGWELNLVTESGVASRGWFDWISPTSRLWLETLQQGAVYSADGMTIQFDRGARWDRIADPQHAIIASCARRFRSYDADTQTYLGRDGLRHPCP